MKMSGTVFSLGVMADWAKYFPPITKERLAMIGDISPGDKQKMKGLDELPLTNKYGLHPF
jgi:hypothetical protein